MKDKFCQRCGSSNLIADRALAGRIVCSLCGSTKIGNRRPFGNSSLNSRKLNKFFLILVLVVIAIIIIK